MQWKVQRVVSGGQAGVDRAALDTAIEMGVQHGGWCPQGRTAEDGPLAACYHLRETGSAGYRQRTRMNVIDSDGTLVLNEGELCGGTALTVRLAARLGKPHLVLRIEAPDVGSIAEEARQWLHANSIATLNVAGPRESTRPGIYARARAVLEQVLA